MTTKHTPGPWLLRTTPTSAGLCHIVSAADWRGAFIHGDGLRKGVDDSLPKARELAANTQELAANARLIAAAPEMLLALQTIASRTPHRGTVMLHEEELILITQAIARATGEQP